MPKKNTRIEEIQDQFDQLSKEIKSYFDFFRKSLKECEQSSGRNSHSWDSLITSLFRKIEQAHRMAIYGCIVKIHKADAILTKKVVNAQYMSRSDFKEFYGTVFGRKIPKSLIKKIEHATEVRDQILHGNMDISEAKKKQAVLDILDYSKMFNEEVCKHAGFEPFDGDLTGRMGRTKRFDVSTSKWMLKGMGFKVTGAAVAGTVADIEKKNQRKKKVRRKKKTKRRRLKHKASR